ncbi:T9SS C-terminal target domain-containing protein [Fibrisoma montanum]|uniref:T9SS C-terminal target domain-containing protein n=1 Tax=Fibrisoma montanum TaxID=2305895 RepID=A0A418M6P9_9BACT|nr:T9SS type A sorting domain-containing protein [Fibrisoma montanum]RIV21619.1 T9SS C-terminal target domain-containing protein [Fibrisoma montanum]
MKSLFILLVTALPVASGLAQNTENELSGRLAVNEHLRLNRLVILGDKQFVTASQSIMLAPGFAALPGTVFQATISPIGERRLIGKERAMVTLTAYPNPFTAETLVEYTAPSASLVRHTLLDINGQVVREVNTVVEQADGKRYLRLNGSILPTGTYLLRIDAVGQSTTIRLLKQ